MATHTSIKFSGYYGKKITLGSNYREARRRDGYNYGMVCSQKQLASDQFFQFELDYCDDTGYSGSVQFGLTDTPPERAKFCENAYQGLKGLSFILATDFHADTECASLFIGGKPIIEFEEPQVCMHSLVSAGVKYTSNGSLHFILNQKSKKEIYLQVNLPHSIHPLLESMYGVIDLYGQCSRVKLISQTVAASKPVKYSVSEENIQHVHDELTRIEEKKLLSHSTLNNDSQCTQYQQVPPLVTPSQQQTGTHQYCQVPPQPLQSSTQYSQTFAHSIPNSSPSSSQINPKSEVVRPAGQCRNGYLELCGRFLKHTTKIPDNYFDHKYDKCYCESCSTARKDPHFKTAGSRGDRYAVPTKGWVKFGLRLNHPSRIESENLFIRGSKGYHGTQVSAVKSIVEKCGGLLPPGTRTSSSAVVEQPEGHYTDSQKPAGYDTKDIYLTPSLKYATYQEVYAKSVMYTDVVTGKMYKGKVCLKALLEPGTHEKKPQTVLDGKQAELLQIDPLFDNKKLEYSIKAHTEVHIYGLLVNLVEQH